jgi:hypothetical protein
LLLLPQLYIILGRCSLWRRLVFLSWWFRIGERGAWGLGEPLTLRAMMNIILDPCLAVIGRIVEKLSLPAGEPCDDMECTR